MSLEIFCPCSKNNSKKNQSRKKHVNPCVVNSWPVDLMTKVNGKWRKWEFFTSYLVNVIRYSWIEWTLSKLYSDIILKCVENTFILAENTNLLLSSEYHTSLFLVVQKSWLSWKWKEILLLLKYRLIPYLYQNGCRLSNYHAKRFQINN